MDYRYNIALEARESNRVISDDAGLKQTLLWFLDNNNNNHVHVHFEFSFTIVGGKYSNIEFEITNSMGSVGSNVYPTSGWSSQGIVMSSSGRVFFCWFLLHRSKNKMETVSFNFHNNKFFTKIIQINKM